MAQRKQSIISDRELKSLLKKTRSPYIGERADAEQRFKELGTEGIDALMDLVQTKTRLWQKRRRFYFGLVGAFAVAILAFLVYIVREVFIANDLLRAKQLIGVALGGVGGGLGGGLLGGFAWMLFPPVEIILAARLLAQVDDLRGIGALVRVLATPGMDAEVRHSIAQALARLLPRIDKSNAQLIKPEDRAALCRCLVRSHPEKESDLVLSILHALSLSGDSDTLRAVKQFAAKESRSSDITELGRAAAACIARLEASIASSRQSENLLRPAGETPTHNLLRPAAGAVAEDSELLRAASKE